MTDDRMPLADLIQRSGDGDFLRSVAEAVLQMLMEADVEGVIGAGRHERSAERLTWRNGYRERTLETRLGALQLRIPKLRQGSYFPPFLEPRRTSEGLGGSDPGSLGRRGLHPAGRRPRAGDGPFRYQQEHGFQAVQGDRRAGERLPRPS